jgi:ribosomal protein S20
MKGINNDHEAIEELDELSREDALTPEGIVEKADDETSALHKYFEWDNAKAGHAHRIMQARQLVRVIYLEREQANGTPDRPIPAFVSLPDDREGGYRATKEVLNNQVFRAKLEQSALKRLDAVAQEFSMLKVFVAEVESFIARLEAQGFGKEKKAARAKSKAADVSARA